jgi:hypothetical protein
MARIVPHGDGTVTVRARHVGAPLEDHDGGASTVWEYIGGDAPSGQTYDLPYRCLLPVDIEGLLVAWRCLSATHDAHASVRSIAQCMAMGEATGTAAAMAVEQCRTPGDLDDQLLRDELRKNGAILRSVLRGATQPRSRQLGATGPIQPRTTLAQHGPFMPRRAAMKDRETYAPRKRPAVVFNRRERR